jgi:hypothetical protein
MFSMSNSDTGWSGDVAVVLDSVVLMKYLLLGIKERTMRRAEMCVIAFIKRANSVYGNQTCTGSSDRIYVCQIS